APAPKAPRESRSPTSTRATLQPRPRRARRQSISVSFGRFRPKARPCFSSGPVRRKHLEERTDPAVRECDRLPEIGLQRRYILRSAPAFFARRRPLSRQSRSWKASSRLIFAPRPLSTSGRVRMAGYFFRWQKNLQLSEWPEALYVSHALGVRP